jgi:hypothetical protein
MPSVLADAVRTDGGRLRCLVPDSPATVTLRALVRARKDLGGHRVALANQLGAHLAVSLPGAVGLFADLDGQISLRFLGRFPLAAAAASLSDWRLGAWLSANGYCGRRSTAELYRRLAEAPAGLGGAEGRARGVVAEALVAALVGLREQIARLAARIGEALPSTPTSGARPADRRRSATRSPAAGRAIAPMSAPMSEQPLQCLEAS